MAALFAFYAIVWFIYPAGMGLGDVKLALALGAALGWYGWGVLFAGTFLGFLLGAAYGVSLILAGRADRRTAMAFGPFMVLGALAGVVAGGLAA
jgi:leader peptidase (prepilin peptidase)/N-methyltransferase